MKTASCPSCGAPVTFKSAASLYAVCDFCRSTLLRDGEALENMGRMAELLEDPTRIQLGTEGKYKGVHFAVIGRIQLQHPSGLWNEWHILFDDARSAWLSEAGGEYVISEKTSAPEPIPDFELLAPEMDLLIAGKSYTVTDQETARCIAGEGELPFAVNAGYDVNTADLRGDGESFLTIDYSESPPLLFAGEAVLFSALKLSGLRDRHLQTSNTKAQVFNCPHCAAPLSLHSPAIQSIGCASCGSIIGLSDQKLSLLSRAAQQMKETPALPLGSKGQLKGVAWEVIGYQKRRTMVDGLDFFWSEYLLLSEKDGFAWLVEDRGHWNFSRTISSPPRGAHQQETLHYKGQEYRRFDSGNAETVYVVGEFYWRIKVGERWATENFIAPPYMLSRERSKNEVVWSQGEYLPVKEVNLAFAPDKALPQALGVYANEPNPCHTRHSRACGLFWIFFCFALFVQCLFLLLSSEKTVFTQHLPLVSKQGDTSSMLNSGEFVLKRAAPKLEVKHSVQFRAHQEAWVSLSTSLINAKTGQTWHAPGGVKSFLVSEKSWGNSEPADSRQESQSIFEAVPSGTYYLVLDYQTGQGLAPVSPSWSSSNSRPDRATETSIFQETKNTRSEYPAHSAFTDEITVKLNASPAWSNFVLLIIFLALFPLYSRHQRNSFEAMRWNESGSGVDDDGDNGSDDS